VESPLTQSPARPSARPWPIDPAVLFEAVPSAVVALDSQTRFVFANGATEQLLGVSRTMLARRSLEELVAPHATLLALVRQVQAEGASFSDYGVELALVRGDVVHVDTHVAPIPELPGHVLLVLHPCSAARRFDFGEPGRRAMRSVTGLAVTLAHEVKNPLSGIRGAAQLLETAVTEDDRALTRLICEETDRICALVDKMERFGDTGKLERRAVNIHQVLEHVRRIATAGFARNVRFVELYDPALPHVEGDRDALVQVFLNLVKNAAEAVPVHGGQITLVTQYQHGIRMAVGNSRERLELPIKVEVRDNGPGVPHDLVEHLFEPFITTKRNGSGLGLPLVAKIVADHQGTVSYLAGDPGAVFRVRLPAARRGSGDRDDRETA
jgi:two-component system nitrogen regulation sensor histidine kinase GlnL